MNPQSAVKIMQALASCQAVEAVNRDTHHTVIRQRYDESLVQGALAVMEAELVNTNTSPSETEKEALRNYLRDAERWRYAVALHDNDSFNFHRLYNNWSGDNGAHGFGLFVDTAMRKE